MNPTHLNKLCKKIAISADQLRFVYAQIELHLPKATVWAFGSRVAWSHRPASDLDLAVHCDKETAKKALPKLSDVFTESDLPFKVQLLDFDRLPENMRENIKRQYVVLYPLEKK